MIFGDRFPKKRTNRTYEEEMQEALSELASGKEHYKLSPLAQSLRFLAKSWDSRDERDFDEEKWEEENRLILRRGKFFMANKDLPLEGKRCTKCGVSPLLRRPSLFFQTDPYFVYCPGCGRMGWAKSMELLAISSWDRVNV